MGLKEWVLYVVLTFLYIGALCSLAEATSHIVIVGIHFLECVLHNTEKWKVY